ncbi:hypothetical protein [Streptomyces spinosisporus]|uniref:Uncharacterized protein n=1 Tax=Streptomyces spinosisporus TaxID=2927582 RepID=A0ABS9XTE3_9ACTN|nr:hypothetical protein [Streptomyces spinosisporus]MCI3244596.1 hypothetical protein [Streptomyces spinosisporus]
MGDVIHFPQPAPAPGPADPLESALLSAWNNSPEVMDDYGDEGPDDTDD